MAGAIGGRRSRHGRPEYGPAEPDVPGLLQASVRGYVGSKVSSRDRTEDVATAQTPRSQIRTESWTADPGFEINSSCTVPTDPSLVVYGDKTGAVHVLRLLEDAP